MTPRKLKERREKLGLTQAQLARELGVSGNTVSRWELGESKPEAQEMLDKALKWLELSKALQNDPFFDGIEGRIAQIEALTARTRQRKRKELPALIAKWESNPDLAEEVAELKRLLTQL